MPGVLLDWFGGAVISLPLTVAFLMLTDRQRFKQKWIRAILFILYLNAMFIIVGVPGISYIRWDPSVNWIPFTDLSRSNIWGMMLNIALFIPFGGFIPLYFKEFQSLKTALAAGFFMSLVIEVIQLGTPRATDIDDLLMNTLGTLIGYGIAKTVFRRFLAQESAGDKYKLTVIVLLILLTVVFVRYPWMEYLYANII